MNTKYFLLFILTFISSIVSAQNLSFSGGNAHSAMLCASGAVYTMGRNNNGQLGDNTTTQSLSPIQVLRGAQPGVGTYLNFIRQIDAGSGAHNIALSCDGFVYTWGWNSAGQIGDNTLTDRLTPVRVLNGAQTGSGTDATYLDGVTLVSGGNENSYALLTTGELMSWGLNTQGQLGNGNTTSSSLPIYVKINATTNLTNVIQFDGGDDFGVALLSDGTVWTWGENGNKQLGQNNTTNYSYATQVFRDAARTIPLTNIIKVTAGDTHVLALASDGTLWSWGGNWSGQLGFNTGGASAGLPGVVVTSAANVPLTGVIAISAGNQHSIAALSNGTVVTWGGTNNYQGQTGTGSGTTYPTVVPALSGIVDVSDGDLWTFAVSGTGGVYVWGQNGSDPGGTANDWWGSLGLGTTTLTYPTPQLLTLPCTFALQCVVANAGPDAILCNPSSTTLQASPNAANFSYRWRKDGILIAGATTSSLFVNTSGTYRVTIWDSTMVNGCGICAPDSDEVVVTNTSPVLANNANFCAPPCQTVGLSVTAAGSNYDWYSTLTGGVALNGVPSSSFTTPCISTTTTYYVQDRSVVRCNGGYSYGAAPLSSGATQYYTNADHKFTFDVLSPFTLDSITVRFDMINYGICSGVPSASGLFNIIIKNSAATTIATISPILPCGAGAVTVKIPIGYTFATANGYTIEFGGGVGTAIYYFQNGAVYPKTDCGLIRYIGNGTADADDWGGMFDWNLRVGTNTCARTPVQAILNCSLPAKLISFTGNHLNNYNLLTWTTTNEEHIKLFYIQRSIDGVNFETIGSVQAYNSEGTHTYEYTDYYNSNGAIVYYQLIQVEEEGNTSSSEIISLSSASGLNIQVMPNPSSDNFKFSLFNPFKEVIKIKVMNIEGKLLVEKDITDSVFNVGGDLSSGIYFVTVSSQSEHKTIKIIKTQ